MTIGRNNELYTWNWLESRSIHAPIVDLTAFIILQFKYVQTKNTHLGNYLSILIIL